MDIHNYNQLAKANHKEIKDLSRRSKKKSNQCVFGMWFSVTLVVACVIAIILGQPFVICSVILIVNAICFFIYNRAKASFDQTHQCMEYELTLKSS